MLERGAARAVARTHPARNAEANLATGGGRGLREAPASARNPRSGQNTPLSFSAYSSTVADDSEGKSSCWVRSIRARSSRSSASNRCRRIDLTFKSL